MTSPGFSIATQPTEKPVNPRRLKPAVAGYSQAPEP